MALKTATDFEASVKFLIEGMTEEMNTGIQYQTKFLDSDSFNSTFDVIEGRLNRLYEKTRVMEDVVSYAREFLEQTIYETTKECRSILDALEDNRDSLKTNSYITHGVSLAEGTGAYTDRDGSSLPHTAVNNGLLTLSGQNASTLPIKTIERKAGPTPYKSNLSELSAGTPYRVFYMMDGPVNGGLLEDVYVELNAPSVINFLEIVPSNCFVSNVRYIGEDGTIEYEDEFKSIIRRQRTVKAVQFSVQSNLYRSSTYYIDKSRAASNFWDRIKEYEYNTNMGVADVADLDQLTGINAFKEAYKVYVAAMNDWIQRRTSVANTNIANGYSDSVPYVNMLTLPDNVKQDAKVNTTPFNGDPVPTVERGIRYGEEYARERAALESITKSHKKTIQIVTPS